MNQEVRCKVIRYASCMRCDLGITYVESGMGQLLTDIYRTALNELEMFFGWVFDP